MPTSTPRVARAATALPLTVLVVVATAIAGLAPAGAATADDSYVALGDSYSSGTGTGTYVDDGTRCLRSALAYASLIAARRGYALNLRACSGAVVADVRRAQLGALRPATDRVTISVGGNDAGFADVLTTCAAPWWFGRCGRAIDDAQAFIRGTLPARLRRVYRGIANRAPRAEVVVVGYPRLLGEEDCDPLTFFSARERARLNATADLINRRTRRIALRRGFAFADPTRRFDGHAVCADEAWLNGLSFPVVESYHPNRTGHARGYRPVVGGRLPMSAAARGARGDRSARGHVPAAEIAATQRRYAGLDAGIRPERVRPPDLTTPRARRAARRANVDIDRWIARQRR